MKKLILLFLVLILELTANEVNNASEPNSSTQESSTLEQNLYLAEEQPVMSACDIVCPSLKEGFFARVKNFDLKSGKIECFVYNNNDFINAVATVSHVNSQCVKALEPSKVNLNKVDVNAIDKIHYYDSFYFGNASGEYVNAPKYLLSALTLDNSIVNVQKSLENNEITLQQGYSVYNAQTNDTTGFFKGIANKIKSWFGSEVESTESFKNLELVSSIPALISDSTMFLMHFLNENNQTLSKLKMFLFTTILPVLLMTAVAQKGSKAFQKIKDNEDILEKIGVGVFIVIFFFMSSIRIETDRERHISQSMFHNFTRPLLYQGAKFADTLSKNATIAYLKSNAKDAGVASHDDITKLMTSQSIKQKEQSLLLQVVSYCHDIFDIKNLRNDVNSKFGISSNFPPLEILNYEDKVLGKRTSNFYSFLKDSSMKNAEILSVTACFQAEQDYLKNKNELKNIDTILAKYQDSRFNDTLNNQLDILTKVQLRNAHELGFLSTPLLATTSIALNSLGVFDVTKVDSTKATENALKAYRKSQNYEVGNMGERDGFISSSVASAIGATPYLLLPGADSIQSKLASIIKSEEEQQESSNMLRTVVRSILAVVPGGQAIAGADLVLEKLNNIRNSDMFVTIVSSIITILIMMYIILYLPVIAISMASFAVIFFYFLNVEIFYIASPFVIAFAFVSNQLEILKSVFKTLLILAFRPILIVVSVILAMFAFDFFTSINCALLEQQFEPIFAMTQAMQVNSISSATTYMTADFGLVFIKGFISMGISIVALIVCFYLVLNGANLILDMFGVREASFDAQSIMGDKVEGKSNKVNTPTI